MGEESKNKLFMIDEDGNKREMNDNLKIIGVDLANGEDNSCVYEFYNKNYRGTFKTKSTNPKKMFYKLIHGTVNNRLRIRGKQTIRFTTINRYKRKRHIEWL